MAAGASPLVMVFEFSIVRSASLACSIVVMEGRASYSIFAIIAACVANSRVVAATAKIGCPTYSTKLSANKGSSPPKGLTSLCPGISLAERTH